MSEKWNTGRYGTLKRNGETVKLLWYTRRTPWFLPDQWTVEHIGGRRRTYWAFRVHVHPLH